MLDEESNFALKIAAKLLEIKTSTYLTVSSRLAVDMDIHGYIHGYIHVWISDFSHPVDMSMDIHMLSHL